MGKLKGFAIKEDGATILFKKSQRTIYTQSRTCSGLSLNLTKSGILQLKKSVSQSKNYSVGGKIKRDLSIETDICILRRYVKKKKNRLSLKGSKTKYSTSYNLVDTEIDTITEFPPDTSACGDSEREVNIQYDLAKLMVDNFKSLLNRWVERYLLENKDSNDKASVLYSMLHDNKTEKNCTSTSGSTFIIDRKCMRLGVKNKRVDTRSVCCEHCRNVNWISGGKRNIFARSCNSISIPVSKRNDRVISTLSIPKKKRSNSKCRVKKSKDKSYNITKNHSLLLDFSSFDLLTISTKSLTKRCATYNCDGKKRKQKKKIKPINTDTITHVCNGTKTTTGQLKMFDALPSLMKSIYIDPTKVSIDENINEITNDHCTMTDAYPTRRVVSVEMNSVDLYNIQSACEMHVVRKPNFMLIEDEVSEPLIKIDIRNESFKPSNIFPKPEVKTNDEFKQTVCNATNTDKENSSERKMPTKRRKLKFNNITTESKRFRVKRDKRKERRGQQFLDHFQNVFQYFADAETQNKMKLDIHVTMMPVPAGTFHHQGTDMSAHNFDETDIKNNVDVVYNVENNYLDKDHCSEIKDTLGQERNIIPLLDGADNQAKYIFKSGSSSNKTSKDNTAPENTNNTLSENRNIIFTESNVKNDISELKYIIKELAKKADILTKERNKLDKLSKNNSNISKAIQLSKEAVAEVDHEHSVKSSHDSDDRNEFYNRLTRKSTSYNIIESESILRVTDMTSAANRLLVSSKSLPPSNSEVHKTNEIQKQSILTYFYDRFDKKFGYRTSSDCRRDLDSSNAETDGEECRECNLYLSNSNKNSSGQKCRKCNSNPVRPGRKTGMSFLEGLFYCLILWIPIIIVASLFYVYIIKDLIVYKSKTATTVARLAEVVTPAPSKLLRRNAFKMSDLGF